MLRDDVNDTLSIIKGGLKGFGGALILAVPVMAIAAYLVNRLLG